MIAPASGSWRVEPAEDGLRLDAFLHRRGLAPSAAAARRLCERDGVRVDGRRGKKGRILRAGEAVALVAAKAPAAAGVRPPPPEVAVLFADAELVAIDKPAGLPSLRLRADDGPTAADAVVARFPECAGASPDPRQGGLLHRLDAGTSGVLLAARRPEAWPRLRAALVADTCEKIYLAEVTGALPEADGRDPFLHALAGGGVVVTAPIGRAGRRAARVVVGRGRGLLDAETAIRALEHRAASTLIEARLHRGRAHQVRAHLGYLGCPVLGDPLYGAAPGPAVAGLRLHAAVVTFARPGDGKVLRIAAPPPVWARVGVAHGDRAG